METTVEILIMTFELVELDEAAYRQRSEAFAPVFTHVPGLVSKLWIADPAQNTYGGVYVFRNRAAREAYLESDIVRALKANPQFGNIAVRAYGTLEEATAITAGPLAPQGAWR